MIAVLQGSLRMPVSSFVFPFFVVFGGGAVGVRGKFMLLGGSAVVRRLRRAWSFLLWKGLLAMTSIGITTQPNVKGTLKNWDGT